MGGIPEMKFHFAYRLLRRVTMDALPPGYGVRAVHGG